MIWIFLADGFEETEALATADILVRAGNRVSLIKAGDGEWVRGSHGITVRCDATTEELPDSKNLRCVVLPGGMPGTLNLEKNETVQQVINLAVVRDIYIAAICAAPSILGHKGLLKGRKATCFPGYEQELSGAEVTGAPVEQDGKIITARGMGVADSFGLKLVELLNGEKAAAKIGASLQREEKR